MNKKLVNGLFSACLLFGLVACGGEAPTPSTDEPATPAPVQEEQTPMTSEEPEEEAPASDLVAEMSIDLAATGDMMNEIAYAPAEITAAPYTVVELNFTNQSTMAGMNHNAVIIPFDEAVADEMRKLGQAAGGPEFSPSSDQIIAKTKMLEPGQNDAIVFETPGPGKYYIICTFPGHKQMMGTLVVE